MKNSVLGKIQNKVSAVKTEERQLAEYLSKFDFESFEIADNDKEFVVEREAIFIKNGRMYSDSIYEMCMALFEVRNRLVLDYEVGFMAWYEYIGLNKDKVSCLLKRAKLYFEFPEYKVFITGLSDLAVKAITGKNVTLDTQKEIIQNRITAVKDIRQTIELSISKESDVVVAPPKWRYFNVQNVNKIQKNIDRMDSKDIFEAQREIDNFKKLLKDIEKDLKVKEKEFENVNNLTLDCIELNKTEEESNV